MSLRMKPQFFINLSKLLTVLGKYLHLIIMILIFFNLDFLLLLPKYFFLLRSQMCNHR